MATDDRQILVTGTASAPADWTVPGNGQIRPKCITAAFDGSGAASTFFPAIKLISDAGVVVGIYPCLTSVAAGGSAEVSWFPRVGGASGGGGGGPGGTRRVPIPLTVADSGGNGYAIFSLNQSFISVRQIIPGFPKSVDGTWSGVVDIPPDYSSGGAVVLRWTVNNNAGAVRWIVGSAVVADGSTFDKVYTNEAAQNVSAPALAGERVSTTFALSTTPVSGESLEVVIERNGANGADTCANDVMLWGCLFEYTAAY